MWALNISRVDTLIINIVILILYIDGCSSKLSGINFVWFGCKNKV